MQHEYEHSERPMARNIALHNSKVRIWKSEPSEVEEVQIKHPSESPNIKTILWTDPFSVLRKSGFFLFPSFSRSFLDYNANSADPGLLSYSNSVLSSGPLHFPKYLLEHDMSLQTVTMVKETEAVIKTMLI